MLLLMIGLCVVNVKLLDHPEHITVGLLLHNYDVYSVCALVAGECSVQYRTHAHPHTYPHIHTHVHTYIQCKSYHNIVLTECVEDM